MKLPSELARSNLNRGILFVACGHESGEIADHKEFSALYRVFLIAKSVRRDVGARAAVRIYFECLLDICFNLDSGFLLHYPGTLSTMHCSGYRSLRTFDARKNGNQNQSHVLKLNFHFCCGHSDFRFVAFHLKTHVVNCFHFITFYFVFLLVVHVSSFNFRCVTFQFCH